jgi:hypothetical protein
MPGLAAAQTRLADPPRIRITGPESYEIPGALRIAGGNITGSRIESIRETVVRVRTSEADELVTIPRPGRRVVGNVVRMSEDTIELSLEDDAAVARVPLGAIAKLEVSGGRKHSRGLATAAGVGVGVSAFMGGGWLAFSLCGSLDCDLAPLSGFAIGIALGAFTGHRMAGERWEPVTPTALRERLRPTSR